jgi:hypothetical protein
VADEEPVLVVECVREEDEVNDDECISWLLKGRLTLSPRRSIGTFEESGWGGAGVPVTSSDWAGKREEPLTAGWGSDELGLLALLELEWTVPEDVLDEGTEVANIEAGTRMALARNDRDAGAVVGVFWLRSSRGTLIAPPVCSVRWVIIPTPREPASRKKHNMFLNENHRHESLPPETMRTGLSNSIRRVGPDAADVGNDEDVEFARVELEEADEMPPIMDVGRERDTTDSLLLPIPIAESTIERVRSFPENSMFIEESSSASFKDVEKDGVSDSSEAVSSSFVRDAVLLVIEVFNTRGFIGTGFRGGTWFVLVTFKYLAAISGSVETNLMKINVNLTNW